MKKTILVLAATFIMSSAFAQDLTSKKGEPFLPEADDWAVSIEATPLLSYMGNLLNGNTSNSPPTWNFLNSNQTIIGKMFKDEKTAYRAIVRLGFGSTTQKELVDKPVIPPAPPPAYPTVPEQVTDEYKSGGSFIGLGAGLEMRRGKTRLQGFYGADAMLWTSGGKDSYTYGNALAPGGTPPVTVGDSYDFGSNLTGVFDSNGNPARVTEEKSGRTIGFGVRGFIGAEYFIFPKISIGGEFGWGLGFSKTGTGSMTIESANGSNVGTQTFDTGSSGSFGIDVDQNAFATGTAQLRLNLHF